MPGHLSAAFTPWPWMRAWQETWLAGVDPQGAGRWLQQARLARLIEKARRESPLYAQRARKARQLGDFEPIGKAALMAHFDDWCTDRRLTRRGAEAHLRSHRPAAPWLDRYILWTSSGTSGEPGLFVQDADSLAAYDALDALRLRACAPLVEMPGLWGMGRRFAYVGAIGGPYAGIVNLERLQQAVPAPWRPQVECISVLEPMTRVASRLQSLQPDVLITYPSCAAALAQLRTAGQLALRLDELWLGGEQLSPVQRRQVAEAFDCTVRNSYGASEFYAIAFECQHGRLHLNDDWVLLEPVDSCGRPVAEGSFSEMTLLTNLANHTQPLLRYELADRVRFLPGPCPCGNRLPVIEIEGRGDEVVRLPGRHGGRIALLPLALETVLEEEAGITRFQLLVHADDRVELRLSDQDARCAFERCRAALLRHLDHHQVAKVSVLKGSEPPARKPGSGKLCRLIDLRGQRRAPPAARSSRAPP